MEFTTIGGVNSSVRNRRSQRPLSGRNWPIPAAHQVVYSVAGVDPKQPLTMRPSYLLAIAFALILFTPGCSQPSGEMGDVALPGSFDKSEYLAKHFEHLGSYCELLEYLYSKPDSDPKVISDVERLVSAKILIVKATTTDVSELDFDSVRALLAVLNLAENERFGDEMNLPLVLNPSVEYLRSIHADLEKRREYLASRIEY